MKQNKFKPFEPESHKIADKIVMAAFGILAIPALLTSPYGLYCIVKGTTRYYFRKTDFHREIKRLQKKNFIALTKTDRGFLIKILNKGRKRYDLIQMNHLKLQNAVKWDGKWRIFIFDIPEKMRTKRDLMRSKLKELGLYSIQRSVFAYPYDCRHELEMISKYYNLHKYTTYAQVDYIDIEKELIRYFKTTKILT